MWFNEKKCKVLHQERNRPSQQCMLRATQLESSWAENNWGFLIDTKMNMSEQCAFALKKNSAIMGCIKQSIASRLRKVIFFPYSALERPHLGALCPVLISSVQERESATGKSPTKDHKDD